MHTIPFKIDELEEIIELGELEEYFYDIGMEDTPHTFFANDILVHNSNFFSITPLLKCNSISEEGKQEYCIDTTKELAAGINKLFEYMMPKVFNVPASKNKIKIVPDIIAQRAIWFSKKRYALLTTFNFETGKPIKDKLGNVGKIKIKGVDSVRSSYAPRFRTLLTELIEQLLRGKDTSQIDQEIMEFEENINNLAPVELCKTSSIKFISMKGDKNYSKGREPFGTIKGSPVTAKSGNFHNDLLKIWKLDKTYEMIKHGDKCKWVYLMPNPYNIDSVAFRGDQLDSEKLMEFISEYIDKQKIYTKELKTKLIDIYAAINRNFPNRGSEYAAKIFNFNEEW
jgi:hypothetical protein